MIDCNSIVIRSYIFAVQFDSYFGLMFRKNLPPVVYYLPIKEQDVPLTNNALEKWNIKNKISVVVERMYRNEKNYKAAIIVLKRDRKIIVKLNKRAHYTKSPYGPLSCALEQNHSWCKGCNLYKKGWLNGGISFVFRNTFPACS